MGLMAMGEGQWPWAMGELRVVCALCVSVLAPTTSGPWAMPSAMRPIPKRPRLEAGHTMDHTDRTCQRT